MPARSPTRATEPGRGARAPRGGGGAALRAAAAPPARDPHRLNFPRMGPWSHTPPPRDAPPSAWIAGAAMADGGPGTQAQGAGTWLPAWLRAYRGEWLRPDVMGGLVTSAVVIPKAMAYATIAGLPVQVGLYTVLAPMVVYALLGTSRVLSVSTTTTIAILVGAELAPIAQAGDPAALLRASATLTLLVGALLLLASALRLGFVANFISEPVLVGFKAGIGIVIVLDQVPKLLGVHFAKGGFAHNVVALVQALPHTLGPVLLLSVVTLLLLVGLER